jgi:two-component system chemotaxis response regulator CheB
LKPVKVLVVDDSALIRLMIRDILSSESSIVTKKAVDGQDALERIASWSPDVVTLDVAMPRMGGLETLEKIMKKHPTRVIMLSGLDDPKTVFEALSLGAIDFIVKPLREAGGLAKLRDELLAKINMAAQVDLKKVGNSQRARATRITRSKCGAGKKAVAIGASTGGPPALEAIARALPADFNYPVFIVQHLPVGFSHSLAKRLDAASKLKVKQGKHGEVVQGGVVYLAPGGYHLTIDRPKSNIAEIIRLDQEPPQNGLRPCVDRLMNSVAEIYGAGSIGVILTGMGHDGAEGMAAIKKVGGKTVVQDRKSCVVFGMSAAAIKKDCADRVVSLENITEEIVKAVSGEEE